MATQSEVLSALSALGDAVVAAVAAIKNPITPPPPVDDSAFLGDVVTKLDDLTLQLNDALNASTSTPPSTPPASTGAKKKESQINPVTGRVE